MTQGLIGWCTYLDPVGLLALCTWTVQHVPWNISEGIVQQGHAPQDTNYHGDQYVPHSYVTVTVWM